MIRDELAELPEWRAEFEELKSSLREAQAEIERGEGTPFDVDEILAEGRRMYAQHPEP